MQTTVEVPTMKEGKTAKLTLSHDSGEVSIVLPVGLATPKILLPELERGVAQLQRARDATREDAHA